MVTMKCPVCNTEYNDGTKTCRMAGAIYGAFK